MGFETERKFLTNELLFETIHKIQGISIKQGYLLTDPERTIRVRTYGDKGFLTIKGKTEGFTRPEFEYEIPVEEARQMLDLFASNVIDKTRYEIISQEYLWEVDVFHGENEGLIVAEIELKKETEEFSIPAWISKEVTGDKRYYNSYIAEKAYKYWQVR